mgnify:CR=1 FL=1
MKKIALFSLVVSMLLSIISCTRVAVALTNKKDPLKKKTVWVKGDKEIVFIPMIHVAKAGYYEKVKDFLSQKRNEGYVVYYENLKNGGKTSEERDTLTLKMRKIIGYHLCGAYTNKENKSTPRYLKKYVGQNMTNTGIDTLRDLRADITVRELIAKIESERGEKIELESCDFETPLNAPYKCSNYKQYYYRFTRKYRDDYLSNLLLNTSDKKIVVIYGGDHKWGVYPSLMDGNFHLKEGKWYKKKEIDRNNNDH